jgi:hypothetical protein
VKKQQLINLSRVKMGVLRHYLLSKTPFFEVLDNNPSSLPPPFKISNFYTQNPTNIKKTTHLVFTPPTP